ncbi:hypothetical protein [Rhodococcus opacus]|nr:hypothetical protein [Rhodococcus opacus]MDJ0418337.1 hypothetical protein [Rhodococcus opacus]
MRTTAEFLGIIASALGAAQRFGIERYRTAARFSPDQRTTTPS